MRYHYEYLTALSDHLKYHPQGAENPFHRHCLAESRLVSLDHHCSNSFELRWLGIYEVSSDEIVEVDISYSDSNFYLFR